MAIVEHRLERWGEWERRHDYQDAYLLNVLSQASLDGAVRKAHAMLTGGVVIISVSQSGVRVITPEEFYL